MPRVRRKDQGGRGRVPLLPCDFEPGEGRGVWVGAERVGDSAGFWEAERKGKREIKRAAKVRRPKKQRALGTPEKQIQHSRLDAVVNGRVEGLCGEWKTRTSGAAEQPSTLLGRAQYPHREHSPRHAYAAHIYHTYKYRDKKCPHWDHWMHRLRFSAAWSATCLPLICRMACRRIVKTLSSATAA